MQPTEPALELTVIVATIDCGSSIGRCLTSIRASCAGLSSECIVVDASDDETADLAGQLAPDALIVRRPAGTLVPELWAEGLRHARGSSVAFTIGECAVTAAWARQLQLAIANGAAGAGGRFTLADDASPTARAMFLLRYSAFLDSGPPQGGPAWEIAGDNAAYSRAALDRHADTFGSGFWEVEFHHLLRRENAVLVLVPGAAAKYSGDPALGTMAKQRFAHGRHFGHWRVGALGQSVPRVVLAAPLVPFLMIWRVARRVRHERDWWLRYAAAIPAAIFLAIVWAAGEAAGALSAGSSHVRHTPAVA